jgi:hypothetical protein
MDSVGSGEYIPTALTTTNEYDIHLIRTFKTHYKQSIHGNYESYSTQHLIDLGDIGSGMIIANQFCDFDLNMYLVGISCEDYLYMPVMKICKNNLKEAIKEAVIERLLLVSCLPLGDPSLLIKQFLASPKMYKHHLDSVNWYQKVTTNHRGW